MPTIQQTSLVSHTSPSVPEETSKSIKDLIKDLNAKTASEAKPSKVKSSKLIETTMAPLGTPYYISRNTGLVSVHDDDEKFEVEVDIREMGPEELQMKMNGKVLILKCFCDKKDDPPGYDVKHFCKKIYLPQNTDVERISSSRLKEGILTVTAPKLKPEANGQQEGAAENNQLTEDKITSDTQEKLTEDEVTSEEPEQPSSVPQQETGKSGLQVEVETSADATEEQIEQIIQGFTPEQQKQSAENIEDILHDLPPEQREMLETYLTGDENTIINCEKLLDTEAVEVSVHNEDGTTPDDEGGAVESIEEIETDYQIQVDISGYEADEIAVKPVAADCIVIEGKHRETVEGINYVAKQFSRKVTLPTGVNLDNMSSDIQGNKFIVTAPKGEVTTTEFHTLDNDTEESLMNIIRDIENSGITDYQITTDETTTSQKSTAIVQEEEDTESKPNIIEDMIRNISTRHNDILNNYFQGDKDKMFSHYNKILDFTSNFAIPVSHYYQTETSSTTEELQEYDDRYETQIDVSEYDPKNITVETEDDMVVVEGKITEDIEGKNVTSKQFHKRFTLPSNVDPRTVSSTLSKSGTLTITAHKEPDIDNSLLTTGLRAIEEDNIYDSKEDADFQQLQSIVFEDDEYELDSTDEPLRDIITRMNQTHQNIIQKHYRGDADEMIRECDSIINSRINQDPFVPLYSKALHKQIPDTVTKQPEFEVLINVAHYHPSEIAAKTLNNLLIVEARHKDTDGEISRELKRKYILPPDVIPERITSTLSKHGLLSIRIPRCTEAEIKKKRKQTIFI